MNNKRNNLKSISYDTLSADFGHTSVEGLRKLALTYKNTLQGKADLDKYRNSYKSVDKPVDPRFRRMRTLPPCESTTKSDMKMSAQIQVTSRQPMSSPAVSSLPSTSQRISPRTTPRKKLKTVTPKCNAAKSRCSNELKDAVRPKTVEGTSFIESLRVHDANVQVKPKHTDKAISSLSTTEDIVSDTRNDEDVDEKDMITDVKTINSVTSIVSHDGHGGFNYRHYQSGAEQNNSSLMSKMKFMPYQQTVVSKFMEHVNVPPLELKKSKSLITLPSFAMPKMTETYCMCVKCACVIDKKEQPYSYNPSDDGDGTNTVVETVTYATIKRFRRRLANSLWKGLFFGCGSLGGVLLVACIGWLLSNNLIWAWINSFHQEPQKSKSIFYSIISTCGGVVLYSMNFILSSVYKILVFPRNAVYGNANEANENRWWGN